MYNKTVWEDAVKDANGVVIQKGTPLSSKNMNTIEDGITEESLKNNELSLRVIQLARDLDDVNGEMAEVNLVNSAKFPFNNSKKTISLKKPRNTINYTIDCEVTSGENIGEIEISDKQLNGFKIAFTGSAAEVNIKLYVKGGIKIG